MKHPFKVAMTALAMCIATSAFATESNAELQSETTLAQELNLSSAQVEQIKGLREQATKELSSVKLDAIGQDVIVNMIKSGKWDEAAAKKQLQTISDVQAQARYYRAHYLFEVSKVLTAEQKAKLHEMLTGSEAMY
ncbi:Spy/CpxP family protein refolding chaperone [Aeromonas sanarellii]|uniref:Spy/CpxP family protein refolding chaperone n=1 Tax=Aeromonas sanarellii TaxID=633415 RepID=A0ABS4B5D3_9GAMM|nr:MULTISPECIES: Spy/CpxP family protein refolding chaperone [Aeromonas]MBP0602698.1 Spy/CpxP family protein refolding chaperone [Aeromonas sanarellii]QXC31769.1 Spy/CpxP family protein refolding chaperone [Aeromonas sp. FDAARGOS 1409]QXW29120.1 Spy/CpxP family protein refolding chaperone [Aeromonas sanarellii]